MKSEFSKTSIDEIVQ